jgi:hypothetical protein
MLPEFYQKTLQKYLTTAQLLVLGMLLNVLQSSRQAKLLRLAGVFPSFILAESRRRPWQRFLYLPQLTVSQIWYPLITNWLTNYCRGGQTLSIVIDRSQWGTINLLMVSLVWERRAIPLYWSLLPKLGSSNFCEQRDAIAEVLPILKNYKIVVLGDAWIWLCWAS